MRTTAEIITRLLPVVILALIAGLAGCSNGEDELPDVDDQIRGGIVEKGAPQPGGAEGEISSGSTADPGTGSKPVDMNEPGGDKSSLVYSREFYSYKARKKKDPFVPLLTEGGKFEGLTLSEMTLTGILWNEEKSMAVMEDSKGRGYLMQIGDKIAGAKLVAIREDAAVFRVVEFGVVHNIEKKLFIQEEKPI